ncbi:MAG TPA: hypothetical protein VGM43_18220 [Bryobacteraceae bacterium]
MSPLTLIVESPPDGSGAQLIKAIADLIAAIAWPLVILFLVLTQRKRIGEFLATFTAKFQASTRIKIWDIVDLDLSQTAQHAEQRTDVPREVPTEQRQAATRVSGLVSETELPNLEARLAAMAREYEATRAGMAPGPGRTRAFNVTMSKMRVLALAAKPLLRKFSSNSESAGLRLAAIAILQMSPDMEYVNWLVERMGTEQPFVFFQASNALLSAVRAFGSTHGAQLKAAIERALETVHAFHGTPDVNTIETLELAARELHG